MLLNKKQLVGLPVFTQSGRSLGRVVDFQFDIDTQSIKKYQVTSRDIIKGLLAKELLIDREQVIFISEEKMVVDDLVAKNGELKKESIKTALPAN